MKEFFKTTIGDVQQGDHLGGEMMEVTKELAALINEIPYWEYESMANMLEQALDLYREAAIRDRIESMP